MVMKGILKRSPENLAILSVIALICLLIAFVSLMVAGDMGEDDYADIYDFDADAVVINTQGMSSDTRRPTDGTSGSDCGVHVTAQADLDWIIRYNDESERVLVGLSEIYAEVIDADREHRQAVFEIYKTMNPDSGNRLMTVAAFPRVAGGQLGRYSILLGGRGECLNRFQKQYTRSLTHSGAATWILMHIAELSGKTDRIWNGGP